MYYLLVSARGDLCLKARHVVEIHRVQSPTCCQIHPHKPGSFSSAIAAALSKPISAPLARGCTRLSDFEGSILTTQSRAMVAILASTYSHI